MYLSSRYLVLLIGIGFYTNLLGQEIRLVPGGGHGDGISSGRIEGHWNSSQPWGAIAAPPEFQNFKEREANFVCNFLNYTYGIPYRYAFFGEGRGYHINIYGAKCPKSAESFMDCIRWKPFDGYSWLHVYDVGVFCYNNNNSSEIRFKLGPHVSSGPVQVRHFDNHWGAVGLSGWTDKAAKVACMEMGFIGGIKYLKKEYASVSKAQHIKKLNCTGNETRLGECVTEWGDPLDYATRAGAHAICFTKGPPRLSLENGTSYSGRVQLSVNGLNGSICHSTVYASNVFANSIAHIVCKELGFPAGKALDPGYFGAGSGEVFLETNPNCIKTTEKLLSCPFNNDFGHVSSACGGHYRDLAVQCTTPVRLKPKYYYNDVKVDGRDYGYVEFTTDGRNWKTVCGGIDSNTADIICRELDFPFYKILSDDIFYPKKNSLKIVITCNGDEGSVMNCNKVSESCNSTAALSCSKQPFDTDLKVVSNNIQFKFSEIAIEQYNVRGTICSQGWDDVDALVFCKQQGFKYGTKLEPSNQYDHNARLVRNFECSGSETSLQQCSYSTDDMTSCNKYNMGASALCSNTEPVTTYTTVTTTSTTTETIIQTNEPIENGNQRTPQGEDQQSNKSSAKERQVVITLILLNIAIFVLK